MNRENSRVVDLKILKGRSLPRLRVLRPRDSADLWQKDLTPYHLGVPFAALGAYLWGHLVRSPRSSSQRILPAFTRASDYGVTEGVDRVSSFACHWITRCPSDMSAFIPRCHIYAFSWRQAHGSESSSLHLRMRKGVSGVILFDV